MGTEITISIKQAGYALSQRHNTHHQFAKVIQFIHGIKRFRPYSLHAAVIIMILSLITMSGHMSDYTAQNAAHLIENGEEVNGFATTSAYVAANVADGLDLSLAERVTADTQGMNGEQQLLAAGDDYVANVSTIATDGVAHSNIIEYVAEEDDTVRSIASAFDITTDTLRWANNIGGSEEVQEGEVLFILPVDGVLHTVEEDETAADIAAHYGADADYIISFNDAEVDGLTAGQQIIVPDGILPVSERPQSESAHRSLAGGFSSAGSSSSSSGFRPSYSGANGYVYGYCTWYVAEQMNIPNNWGNATTWAANAQATPGWRVSRTPVPGAIAQSSSMAGGIGHVGIVEGVNGSQIKMSDMNGFAGFGRVGTGSAPAGNFVYIIPE